MATELNSIFIFDAGSTKTDVISSNFDEEKFEQFTISGFNPNRSDTNFVNDLLILNIPKNATVYFYGSGISNIKSQNYIKSLFNVSDIHVASDLLGASRASLGNSKGIVSIMGTGGIVAYYNSSIIENRNGGYGFLIDDFGGSYELGKIIVSNWLNLNFSKHVTKEIENYFNLNITNFISDFYKNKDLHKLAGVCEIIIPLSDNCKILNNSIQNYFNLFFSRHVKPICDKNQTYSICTVGSIAYYFEKWIVNSADKHNIVIKSIIKKPILELLKYHQINNNHPKI